MKKIISCLPIAIVCTLAILLGYLVGNYITTNNLSFNHYSISDVDMLTDDITNINYKNKTPDVFSASDAYLIAYKVLAEKNCYKKESYGKTTTSLSINQDVYLCQQKNGNSHSIEMSNYSAIIKKAIRVHFETQGNITLFEGRTKSHKPEDTVWNETSTIHTKKEYIDMVGQEPTKLFAYIISSKTVIDYSLRKSNNLYKFEMSLHPELSTITYKKVIAFNSGANASTITFEYISISFELDDNFNIISESIDEVYSMNYAGIGVKVNAKYETTFN